ncbi:MAG: hypothetical protein ACLFWF_07270 [Alphaproteobacteria bacterium]
MRISLCALLSVLLSALPAAAERPDSQASPRERNEAGLEGGIAKFAYTSLDLEDCEMVDRSKPDEPGPGWARWRCEGLTEDWPVRVSEGDGRFAVSYGPKAGEEPAARQFFAPFNHIHDKLEWVLSGEDPEDLKPVATILRFFLQVGEKAGLREHPVLVVTQLKPGAVCQIAYVDARANPDANRDARAAALRLAGSFDCAAEPELVGPQSPELFGE